MITDITIGQYFPGDSVVHKMDSRMKIILTVLLIVAIFICKTLPALGVIVVATIALVLISKIPLKTEDGIMTAVFMAIRIITLVVISSLLTYTTSPNELTDGLERLMKPLKILKIDVHSISMTMTIALRFIPTLIEEIDKIMSAQKSRGADMDSGGLIHRAKALVPVLIPLFISAFRRANELAYAMECRCYRGGDGRTKMKVMKFEARDYIALAAVIVFIALLISFNFIFKKVI